MLDQLRKSRALLQPAHLGEIRLLRQRKQLRFQQGLELYSQRKLELSAHNNAQRRACDAGNGFKAAPLGGKGDAKQKDQKKKKIPDKGLV